MWGGGGGVRAAKGQHTSGGSQSGFLGVKPHIRVIFERLVNHQRVNVFGLRRLEHLA